MEKEEAKLNEYKENQNSSSISVESAEELKEGMMCELNEKFGFVKYTENNKEFIQFGSNDESIVDVCAKYATRLAEAYKQQEVNKALKGMVSIEVLEEEIKKAYCTGKASYIDKHNEVDEYFNNEVKPRLEK